MIRIVLDNRVRLHGEIPPSVTEELQARFTHANPQRLALKRMKIPGWWTEPEEYQNWKAEPKASAYNYPRGGLERIISILEANSLKYVIDDRRTMGSEFSPSYPRFMTRSPRPHQVAIVEAASEREQCLVLAPTGSGKSFSLLALALRLRVPTLIVVPSAGLFAQWVEAVRLDLSLEPGVIRGKKIRLDSITIAVMKTVHNLVKENNRHVLDYFGAIMFDEVHGAAAVTGYELVDAFPARYRYGTSADHRRKDRREFLTRDLFGEVAYSVERTELEEAGVILGVEVQIIPTGFEARWYGMDPGQRIDFARLVAEMSRDIDRNSLAIRTIQNEIENGEQCIVLTHEVSHVEMLILALRAEGIEAGKMIGGHEAEFAHATEGLASGRLRVAIGTYRALGTGIDLPSVGVAVCLTPILANQQFFGQVRGRVCRAREGKHTARMVMLVDDLIHRTHVTNATRWNENVSVRQGSQWISASDYLSKKKLEAFR